MAISNIEMHKRITRHLENSHIIISPENEWFKQCVDFFISDNPNCDVKDLSAMVVEQLSLSDFQEIGLFSLPANLNNCDKKVLTGKYCLQVNTILNVGQSCYSQYNILVKRDTSNTEIGDDKPAPWEPKTHRMLKMMCSDGQQDIVAMEYESLQCLKEPFIPGFKIVVVGPVEYRKGVLLLKSTNVHFIGGEVEHLLIKNAPLNVLCRALNKPELENPYIFSNIEVENAVMEVHEPSDIIPPRRIENVSTVGIREQNSVIPPTSTNQSNNTNSNHTGSGIITYDDFFDGDDDLLYLTQMAEIETKFTESNNVSLQTFGTDQNNTKVNKTTIAVPKNNNITNKKPAVTAKQTKISDMLGPSTSTAFRGSVAESTRCQNDRSIENNSKNVKQISAKRIASSPVYTETKRPSIELPKPDDDWGDIDMDIDVSNPLIKVLNSASIIKNSKIQVKQNEWICSGIVMDESKHEEAEFSSEVLERLIGISSEEVLQLKNNPSNCAPLKEKIEKGIKGAYRKLHLFKGYRKQTSTMNYSNPACCIKSCDQTACYVFDSMSYDELNTFWIVSKINFRLLNNEEQPSQNICFCKPHYDQVLLISQCELCGNRSMDMVTLQDNVRECQLILNEDNIPITIKCGILICKPCKLYTLLRNDKTIKITCELQKHIDAVITRIKNKNISITNGLEGIQLAKNEINIKKKEESNQLIMVKFLTQYISNFFTADSSIPSQLVSSVLNLDAIRTPPLLKQD
ncbi:recQ-mediated genome instability protein 1-like isoform X2 [Myzus persicae]|uniref:recQ-mediated genome instability protein 1-like isoform X2 n=1 Tax=Myzus persicae TaxID=13164 RepID=UPI000B9322B4|nr:recQ-mediated genome instability protein 1-like isoform X2 [Myzus persicae]